tara:strand:+ start:5368 stop:6666 length:1299 start_codon:yes stop_codon:yes gene_type:complete
MQNYSPTYNFNGAVSASSAPSANDHLVRKQDVAGLSYITAIAGSSSNYISVTNGELAVSNLLITDVKVNNSDATLSAYISNSASGDNLGVGDVVILTSANPVEMYMVVAGTGSQASDYQEIKSQLDLAEVLALLTAGTGINIASDGTFSVVMSDFDTDDLSEGSTNQYFTQARARASVSAGGDLSYVSATGQFSVTTYKSSDFNNDFAAKDTDDLSEGSTNQYFTQARARASFSSGSGISINGSGQISQKINEDKGVTFDAGNNNALQLNISSDFAFDNNGQLLFDLDTDGIQEGSTNQYFTDARARTAISGGNGISYTSGTGAIAADLGDGLLFDLNGAIGLSLGSGLQINSGNQQLEVNYSSFRKEFSNQSLTANTFATLNHSLGQKYVQVSAYDTNDQLIHIDVEVTDNNNCKVKSVSNLSGVTIVVSL